MQFFYRFLLVLLLAQSFVSCKTRKAAISNYLEKHNDTTGLNVLALTDPVIQKNDLLSIRVFSAAIDPRVDAPYNLPAEAAAAGGTTAAGFLVDNNGNIEYPRLGSIRAEGLRKTELAQAIKSRLDTALINPTVTVRFLNYRITVLGEVRSPGTYSVPTESVTILEALGLAGDISDFGNKASVRVMRETNGQMAVQRLDLTKADLFTSPYYRLQQNDVVIVEQTRRKQQLQEQQNVATQIGIATGVITALALIFNFIR